MGHDLSSQAVRKSVGNRTDTMRLIAEDRVRMIATPTAAGRRCGQSCRSESSFDVAASVAPVSLCCDVITLLAQNNQT